MTVVNNYSILLVDINKSFDIEEKDSIRSPYHTHMTQ